MRIQLSSSWALHVEGETLVAVSPSGDEYNGVLRPSGNAEFNAGSRMLPMAEICVALSAIAAAGGPPDPVCRAKTQLMLLVAMLSMDGAESEALNDIMNRVNSLLSHGADSIRGAVVRRLQGGFSHDDANAIVGKLCHDTGEAWHDVALAFLEE